MSRAMPTHFIAAQVSHADGVVTAIEKVQKALIEHDPALKHALVEPVTAHVTLMVSGL
jgi:hypothetical protein